MSASEIPVDINTLNVCVASASTQYGIHQNIIKSLIAVEGGRIGTRSRNSNGTYDMGIMQINTIHTDSIKKNLGYTAQEIIMDPCKNIMAGTWILWQRIKESPQKIWVAVGNYHSKTPRHRHNYLKNVEDAYSRLLPVFGKPGESKAIGRTTNWGNAEILAQADPSAFPSISELEALVASGGGAVSSPSSSGAKSGAKSNNVSQKKSPPKQKTKYMTINNTKRKALRFID